MTLNSKLCFEQKKIELKRHFMTILIFQFWSLHDLIDDDDQWANQDWTNEEWAVILRRGNGGYDIRSGNPSNSCEVEPWLLRKLICLKNALARHTLIYRRVSGC